MAEAPNLRELGLTGLEQYGGVVREEYLTELQGHRWYRVVREMQDDPVAGASLLAIEVIIRGVPWQMRPASDDAEDVEIAEFVNSCLHDMSSSWTDTLTEILSMLPYGWSYVEQVYKFRRGDTNNPQMSSKHNDGRIGWRKWAPRAQDTLDHWEFGEDGGIRGMWQRVSYAAPPVFIPIEKALLFRTTSKRNNPEGRSVFRSAYRPWYMKINVENIEGIGIERDLAGIPVAEIPAKVIIENSTEYTEWKKVVVNLRNDEMAGLVIPSDRDESGNPHYNIRLLNSGGQRQFETGAVIERYERRIAMSVLADFIMLGHERVGSFALSSDKTEMFVTAVTAWLDGIADVINRHAIPRLLRFNGMSTDKPPRLVHGDVAKMDLDVLGQYIVRLAGAGFDFSMDRELEKYLRQQANLPIVGDRPAGGKSPNTAPVAGDDEPSTDAEERVNPNAPTDAVVERNTRTENSREFVTVTNDEQKALILAAAKILERGT